VSDDKVAAEEHMFSDDHIITDDHTISDDGDPWARAQRELA
jgi:hypothetical protein